jgi:hypothetical protein
MMIGLLAVIDRISQKVFVLKTVLFEIHLCLQLNFIEIVAQMCLRFDSKLNVIELDLNFGSRLLEVAICQRKFLNSR